MVALDPAHQLTNLSQQLNKLEAELEEKSSRLKEQYNTLESLTEEISADKCAEQHQSQCLIDKSTQLQSLQAQIAWIVEDLELQTSLSSFEETPRHLKRHARSSLDEAVAAVTQMNNASKDAKSQLKGLQRKARCNKAALRQGISLCKGTQYNISTLDLQRHGLTCCLDVGHVVCGSVEGIRSACLQLCESVASMKLDAEQVKCKVIDLEARIDHAENTHASVSKAEASKAAELQGIMQTLAALMPGPIRCDPYCSTRKQTLDPSDALMRGISTNCNPAFTSGERSTGSPRICQWERSALADAREDDQAVACEYYVEEPISPETGFSSLRARFPSPIIVQPSPVNQEAALIVPLAGKGEAKSAAHVVMRTVECKPQRQGMVGSTQLRLKEVYQTIDSKGNTSSQCAYRIFHGALHPDINQGASHRRPDSRVSCETSGDQFAAVTTPCVSICSGVPSGEPGQRQREPAHTRLQELCAHQSETVHARRTDDHKNQNMKLQAPQTHLEQQESQFCHVANPGPSAHDVCRPWNLLHEQNDRRAGCTNLVATQNPAPASHKSGIFENSVDAQKHGTSHVEDAALIGAQSAGTRVASHLPWLTACAETRYGGQGAGTPTLPESSLVPAHNRAVQSPKEYLHCQHNARVISISSSVTNTLRQRSETRQRAASSCDQALHTKRSLDRDSPSQTTSKPSKIGRKAKHTTKQRARLDVFGGRL
eukprot:jgi/Ulvmu1/8245/UM041_0056.1